MPINSVVVIVEDGVEPFGLGALCEVWAEPYHPDDDNPVFEFHVITPVPGRIACSAGYDLYVEHGLELAETADLVCVAPKRDFEQPNELVAETLRAAHARGAWIFAHCTATYALAQAGLLDGRRCTTHWRYSDRLAATFPLVEVDPDVLYVQDGTILTGAGGSASLDASLHLQRLEFGSKVASGAARRMVVAAQRDGGQAQFIARPVVECQADTLKPLVDWIGEHLDEDLSVNELARRAHMSPRTFARRFREETGATPHQFIVDQRIRVAEEMLEGSDRPVEWIAAEVGFGNAAALRHHFVRARGVSPQQYRRTFAC